MLRAISWYQYFTFIVLAAVAWYLIVLIRYAARRGWERAEKKVVAKNREALFSTQDGGAPAAPLGAEDEGADIDYAENTEWALLTQTVTQEIKSIISAASSEGISNEDLQARLQVLLSNYPHLRHTAYGIAVNDVIGRAAKAAGFNLDKATIVKCWD